MLWVYSTAVAPLYWQTNFCHSTHVFPMICRPITVAGSSLSVVLCAMNNNIHDFMSLVNDKRLQHTWVYTPRLGTLRAQVQCIRVYFTKFNSHLPVN